METEAIKGGSMTNCNCGFPDNGKRFHTKTCAAYAEIIAWMKENASWKIGEKVMTKYDEKVGEVIGIDVSMEPYNGPWGTRIKPDYPVEWITIRFFDSEDKEKCTSKEYACFDLVKA